MHNTTEDRLQENMRRNKEIQEQPENKEHNGKKYIHQPVITLYVNGLNVSIKRHWVTKWMKKQVPFICCL